MRCPVCRGKMEAATADHVARHLVQAHGLTRSKAGALAQRAAYWADCEVIHVCSQLSEGTDKGTVEAWH